MAEFVAIVILVTGVSAWLAFDYVKSRSCRKPMTFEVEGGQARYDSKIYERDHVIEAEKKVDENFDKLKKIHGDTQKVKAVQGTSPAPAPGDGLHAHIVAFMQSSRASARPNDDETALYRMVDGKLEEVKRLAEEREMERES